MEPRVADNPGRSCFEVFDDDELAGFAEYHRYQDEIAFIHTEIDPRFEGRGLGGVLARAALDAAREQGLGVLPFCPFIRGWIGKHPEYTDLVPQGQRARFGL
ncbi:MULTISPECIES: GNAT family N-acetyltransferase [Streptomyces]|uniref:GNAT family N-acetyltransferase n=1 Tax=Streptomyces TaxID=1883 RepID=UPI001B33B984|nr:GNAT family N-acetyltransferase [Streptomyces sp. AgN23]QTI87947.1 N-acetyltransferase [Streptomyces sp. AgN23]WTA80218.1 N-acetyltransferase [Streptomyces antimycoticus]